ncbi:hypothetical protein DSO57_1020992 [Entomophthora muscae]|uniref:Uncharacterized protein n=1 Tax=Entomophthora muscae TaxID=34485 RepID=A0ACC2RI78_9FUNG|nr:hypothetical protein DSO57_1020992 [Entomophthora muscae]
MYMAFQAQPASPVGVHLDSGMIRDNLLHMSMIGIPVSSTLVKFNLGALLHSTGEDLPNKWIPGTLSDNRSFPEVATCNTSCLGGEISDPVNVKSLKPAPPKTCHLLSGIFLTTLAFRKLFWAHCNIKNKTKKAAVPAYWGNCCGKPRL